MKRLFLSLIFASLGLFATTQAQTPAGYAIFGDVPYGYTDLRDNIEVSIPAVISGQDIQSSSVYSTPVDQSSLTFTGNGLSGGHACQNNSALSIRFASDQNMTLDDDMVIHIKLRRTDDNTSGLMRLSMIKGTWGVSRLSFQIANDELTTDISEYEFAYKNPLTSFGVSTYNQGQLIGNDVSYPGNNWKELFRFEAASGEAFEITQIYIDADATVPDPVEPAPGDVDAPTSLTLAASNIRDNSVTLTASATDANSPITYTFYYKAEGDADFTAVAGSVAAASGADAVKVVTGLAPETTYSFKVVATDPSSNSADYSISGITTLAAFKHRFYFFRAGDIPEIDGVVSVDLREGTGTSFQLNNMTKTGATEYIGYTLNGSWFSFNQNLSATTDMSIVSQSTWYLCIKMRTTINQNSFNLRLNNAGECWMISSGNLPLEHDGTWETLALPLSTSSKPLTFTASMTGTIFQMHANGSAASDYIDIEYAYLTDDPIAPEKPAIVDNDAPTNFTVTEKPAATNSGSTTLQLYAEDEDTPITYTIRYAVKNSGDTPTETSVNGAQGSTVEKTISGLAPETTYTFSVVASDPNGNETSPVELDITTAALAAQRYYLWRGDNSDIPSTGGLTSTLVNCNVTYSNNTFTKDTRIDKYLSQKTTSTWFALDVTPSETVENDIDNDWYLVVRFRTNMNNNVFFGNRLQFNFVSGGNNFNISNGEWITFNDGIWHTVSFRIGDHAGTLPPSYLTSGTLAFQLHIGSQVVAGEYLDIDYIYFTNDISDIDTGTQTRKRIALNDAEDNKSVLSANNGQTVDIDLTRSLTNASYNTICLPFDLSAEQVETLFGAGTKIGKLHNAQKEGDELYLNFSFVNAMEAGVPYIIQPTTAVTTPMFLENVTISNTTQYSEFGGVKFIGVFNPTPIELQSAEEHSILLLGANNQLSWPNTAANMKGMRAYFQTTSEIAHVARRAYFGFNETQTTTGIGDVQESQQAVKVLRDGRVLIIRNNEVYDIFGARIQ